MRAWGLARHEACPIACTPQVRWRMQEGHCSTISGMNTKRVGIAGREFVVHGDPGDRYFRDGIRDGRGHVDIPIAVAQRFCDSGATIVDVGANIGLSTLAFAHIARNGQVLAFEPSPRNFALLSRNVAANEVRNVEIVQVALSDREGLLTMVEEVEFMAGSHVEAAGSGPATGHCIEIPATTLDREQRKRGLRRLDLLKIDVEGHERQVIDGARETLDRFHPICVFEFNSYFMVYKLGVSPRRFLDEMFGIFPLLYYFDSRSGRLQDLRKREDVFLQHNREGGFVDDLVGAFHELPGD